MNNISLSVSLVCFCAFHLLLLFALTNRIINVLSRQKCFVSLNKKKAKKSENFMATKKEKQKIEN